MNYKKITLGTLAYFISSFVIQGLLGFAFAGEYFESISIFRNPVSSQFFVVDQIQIRICR